jgi:CIC family chloride channel protein|tara:strand:+ start:728 stop:2566 length:1839 start_codon:yes stop_codon:yes gene_type:complete
MKFRKHLIILLKLLRPLIQKKQYHKALNAFIIWRLKNIPDKAFTLFLCLVVGVLSGVSAALIKNSVHLVEWLLTADIAKDQDSILFFFLPTIGLLLTVLVIKFVIKQSVGHGIPTTLYAISKGKGIIHFKKMFSSIITSAITVGFGGSTGLEGPTVSTTAAIGSNLAQFLRVSHKTRKLLIGCAAAGALSAIFKAPIAAIVFAIEVIMLDLTTASLIPLLIASAGAALTSRWIFGTEVLFHFTVKDPFIITDIPFFILLGGITGLVAVYFTKVFSFSSALFDKLKNVWLKVIIGGVLLGGLIYLLPPLYGEGYETINNLIEGNYAKTLDNSLFIGYRDNILVIMFYLVAVVFLKAFATSLTFGAGGVGGIFAPTLFMGSIIGFVYVTVLNTIGLGTFSVTNYTLVGMAALMAGNLQAPLTAIFLIAEITGGYKLFIPLMIVSSISYLTVRFFVPHSVYTMQLAKQGALITHHKDQAVLTLMQLKNEIENDFIPVDPYADLGDLVKVIAKSKRNVFPVLDDNGYFLGSVQLNDVRLLMFEKDQYHKTLIHELMSAPAEKISILDNMEKVMEKFEASGAWNLPVLDDEKYVGYVSKSKLFSAYRKLLRDFYEED